MVFKSIIGATCAFLSVVSFNTSAALVGRLALTEGGTDYQAYYDTEADLTWLADANYALTSGYIDTITTTYNTGQMTWLQASDFANGLEIADVTGWRLPNIDINCGTSANCTDSEFGNFFYNILGGVAHTPIHLTHNSNYDLFNNVKSSSYWSANELAYPSTGLYTQAWYFRFSDGLQANNDKTLNLYAWAVHDGDVETVPIPSAVWLFGSGLIGLIGIARRKSRN